MNSDSWALVLSVLGLLLGFVSAYGQIKGFFVRIFRHSGESIARWTKKRQAKIDALATFPSALIAYLARSFLFVVGTLLIAFTAIGLLRSTGIGPEWLLTAIMLASGVAVGAELGALHTTILDVSKKALQLAKLNETDG